MKDLIYILYLKEVIERLNIYFSPSKKKILLKNIYIGDTISIPEYVIQDLILYYKYNKFIKTYNFKENWFEIGKEFKKNKRINSFSVLHVSKSIESAYPIGSIIIEIKENQDILLNGNII